MPNFREDNIEVDEKVTKGILENYLGFRFLTAVSLVPRVLVISTTLGASIPANNLFQEILKNCLRRSPNPHPGSFHCFSYCGFCQTRILPYLQMCVRVTTFFNNLMV